MNKYAKFFVVFIALCSWLPGAVVIYQFDPAGCMMQLFGAFLGSWTMVSVIVKIYNGYKEREQHIDKGLKKE